MARSKQVMALALMFILALGLTPLVNAEDQVLKMATTTSTDNTGLLDYLAPRFKQDTGIELQWVSVGTGKALELGKNCDVDVLLVHAPAAEKKFVDEGYGVDRREVMYNDFVIIGPKDDPAKIKGLSAADALKKIAKDKATFVSRGDDSGTNKKEIALWKKAGILGIDKEAWYIQTGQGMMATINVAAERNGYTLTDRGTYITYENNQKGNPPLVILVEGDPGLFNQYSVIPINPKKCPDTKFELAKKFSDWMASPPIQKFIGDFELMGKQLFTPNAK
ncbi:MAG: substrate-binding domain-containing protein [Desulfoferrobacter sp.]